MVKTHGAATMSEGSPFDHKTGTSQCSSPLVQARGQKGGFTINSWKISLEIQAVTDQGKLDPQARMPWRVPSHPPLLGGIWEKWPAVLYSFLKLFFIYDIGKANFSREKLPS